MNICIIQARMGSTRLPGKVLRNVHGKTILQHVVDRLNPSKKIQKIIVATTTNSEDDAIEEFCNSKNISIYRGSDWDVLSRFTEAAAKYGAVSGDAIIRICCDNPIHSWKVVDFVIDQFRRYKVDYFSNSNQEPNYLEDGFDVEVVTYDALVDASINAKLLSEREHVMPYIKNSKQFKLGWRKANDAYTFKLSVDTDNDLRLAEQIFRELENTPDFGINDVVHLLSNKPELLEINRGSEINSGYKKSIREDRMIK
jgi:spore coat polysaccharide biosynthesis protein SpsF